MDDKNFNYNKDASEIIESAMKQHELNEKPAYCKHNEDKVKKSLNRIDIMVDLETLGKGDTPPVIQIAAIAFDIKTGATYGRFESFADISSINNIEGDTLSWWLKTNNELLAKLIETGKLRGTSEKDCFTQFCEWIYKVAEGVGLTDEQVFLWGNGILFDNRIIKNKCRQFGLGYPIFYRNDMDVRTIMEMAAFKMGLSDQIEFRNTVEHHGTLHNAMSDVENQIADVCKAYQVLMSDSVKANVM